MSLLISAERRTMWAKALVTLFLAATMLMGVAGSADAAPRSKCRTNPENFSFYRGKCMTDKRIEFLKERREERREDRRDNNRGEDNHRPHGPNHQ